MADEKDKLVPQLEEAKWRARQAEKELEAATEASAATEQVWGQQQMHNGQQSAIKFHGYCCVDLHEQHVADKHQKYCGLIQLLAGLHRPEQHRAQGRFNSCTVTTSADWSRSVKPARDLASEHTCLSLCS